MYVSLLANEFAKLAYVFNYLFICLRPNIFFSTKYVYNYIYIYVYIYSFLANIFALLFLFFDIRDIDIIILCFVRL